MSTTSADELFLEKYESIEPYKDSMKLSDFMDLKMIGEGAYSKVFKGSLFQNTKWKIPSLVAIKVMDKNKLDKNDLRDMAFHEVRLLMAISSSFIVECIASFEGIENLNIVLEWMPYDLFSVMRSKLYFGEPTARFFASQIILAIEYLHSFNIAYRDLKPENILVGFNGGTKITDMSFAKYIRGRSYSSNGTPEYMAPEVVQSEGHGIGVDWWALGVLLYEMCAGHTPFISTSVLNIMRNIIKSKYKFPMHFSKELKDLVKSLLIVDVTTRLGCMKSKVEDIKYHSWFYDDVDWNQLQTRYYTLPMELSDLSIV